MLLRRRNESDPVRRYSSDNQLRRIDARLEQSVRYYADKPAHVIDARIRELRREWSVERYLQLNAAAVGLTSAALAVSHDRRWGWVTCTALGFFLLHALDGFDPPLPILRQRGVRSRAEIDREIYALKALRGDFDDVRPLEDSSESEKVESALRAVGV